MGFYPPVQALWCPIIIRSTVSGMLKKNCLETEIILISKKCLTFSFFQFPKDGEEGFYVPSNLIWYWNYISINSIQI